MRVKDWKTKTMYLFARFVVNLSRLGNAQHESDQHIIRGFSLNTCRNERMGFGKADCQSALRAGNDILNYEFTSAGIIFVKSG